VSVHKGIHFFPFCSFLNVSIRPTAILWAMRWFMLVARGFYEHRHCENYLVYGCTNGQIPLVNLYRPEIYGGHVHGQGSPLNWLGLCPPVYRAQRRIHDWNSLISQPKTNLLYTLWGWRFGSNTNVFMARPGRERERWRNPLFIHKGNVESCRFSWELLLARTWRRIQKTTNVHSSENLWQRKVKLEWASNIQKK